MKPLALLAPLALLLLLGAPVRADDATDDVARQLEGAREHANEVASRLEELRAHGGSEANVRATQAALEEAKRQVAALEAQLADRRAGEHAGDAKPSQAAVNARELRAAVGRERENLAHAIARVTEALAGFERDGWEGKAAVAREVRDALVAMSNEGARHAMELVEEAEARIRRGREEAARDLLAEAGRHLHELAETREAQLARLRAGDAPHGRAAPRHAERPEERAARNERIAHLDAAASHLREAGAVDLAEKVEGMVWHLAHPDRPEQAAAEGLGDLREALTGLRQELRRLRAQVEAIKPPEGGR
jgi:hypothetical protein